MLLSGGCGALTMLLLVVVAVGCRRRLERLAVKPINQIAGMILPYPDDPRWTRSRNHDRAVFTLGKLVSDQSGVGRLKIDGIEIPDSQDYVKAVERAYTERLAEQALLT
jgi:hypothetical protein